MLVFGLLIKFLSVHPSPGIVIAKSQFKKIISHLKSFAGWVRAAGVWSLKNLTSRARAAELGVKEVL